MAAGRIVIVGWYPCQPTGNTALRAHLTCTGAGSTTRRQIEIDPKPAAARNRQADATIADTLPASARRYACLSLRSKSGCPSGQGLLLCRG
jgi:hypothetical protein